ncbi:hypothetical protein BRADI_1g44881v3 [Brachypodium distachyon]|uniref:60S acidic ribosomal protein P2 n=1 Tax=Brachypodium distachyon TaxID=15368 RepID=A0A0Q3H814_BRADI|nr:hypothetical protein BRADI_1g44881v3 [Brachypodium distachyon]
MKFVAAYLLAHLAGNPSPTKDDVRKILDSVGAEVEEGKLELLFKEVQGKDLAELLAAGREKLAFAPSAGENKKEEKADEKLELEEEDDENMFSLFD